MRKLLALLAVGLAVVAVFVYRRFERSGDAVAARTPSPAREAQPPHEEGALGVATAASVESAEIRRETATPSIEPAKVETRAECHVFGRVVDEDDRPLADVVARLSGYKGWADGVDVPRLAGPYDERGWETKSDAEGAFSFTTPVPTVAITSLTITPDAFHDSASVRFGGDRGETQPVLREGERDLGVFRLAGTGAISGRVSDQNGQPLAKAKLTVGEERWSTIGRNAESDESGRYTIEHVKAGTFGVNCAREEYLSEFRKPCEVVARRTLEGVDFVLKSAPTLRGVVVDENGSAMDGVRIWGWPQSSGAGAGATSAADGTFTIHLPQDEPYRLEAKLDPTDVFGIEIEGYFEPGRDDLRIVLPHAERITVAVVDLATGAPLERFGVMVKRDIEPSASVHMRFTDARPREADHPGGEAQINVRPGLDGYFVAAKGFEDAIEPIGPEALAARRVVVSLGHGSAVIGRALLDGSPAVRAEVSLQAGYSNSVRVLDSNEDSGEVFRPNTSRPVLRAATDDLGRFKIQGVESGGYRLTIRASGGASCVHGPFELGPKEQKDLGDLALVASATIAGRVLVPVARSAAGIEVFLDDWRSGVKQSTDSSGNFRFEGVLPGKHTLHADEVPGALTSSETISVTAVSGQTVEATIDMRACGTCKVALTIDLGSRSAAKLRVELLLERDKNQRHELGETDATGRVEGWAPPCGRARVEISSTSVGSLTWPEPLEGLVMDARVERTLRFELTTLALSLPEGIVLPEHGSATLELRKGDAPVVFGVSAGLTGETSDAPQVAVERLGRRFVIDPVPSGAYELTFSLFDRDAPPTRTETGPGAYRLAHEPLFQRSLQVDLAAERTNEIQLR